MSRKARKKPPELAQPTGILAGPHQFFVMSSNGRSTPLQICVTSNGQNGIIFSEKKNKFTNVIICTPSYLNSVYKALDIPRSWDKHYAGVLVDAAGKTNPSWNVYIYVPIFKVVNFIRKHGGLVEENKK